MLAVVDLLDREQLRHGLAARAAAAAGAAADLRRAVRPVVAAAGRRADRRRTATRDSGATADGDRRPRRAAPTCCAELLAWHGDPRCEATRRFAGRLVERLGRASRSPSGQSFFSYRVLRALSPETLVAAMLAGLLAGERTAAGWPSRSRGRPSGSGIAAFRAASRPRSAAGRPRRRAGTRSQERRPAAGRPGRLPARRSAATWPSCAAASHPLARRLAVPALGPAAARARGPAGLPQDGARVAGHRRRPDRLVTHHRPRKVHKPELVVLCDVSGSVAGLQPLHADADPGAARAVLPGAGLRVRRHHRRGHALFGPGADLADAVARMGARPTWSGSTATATTASDPRSSPRTGRTPSGPKTSLLVLGDGRTNYRDPGPAGARGPGRHRGTRTGSTRSRGAVGDRRLRRRRATARSSRWSSAATRRS